MNGTEDFYKLEKTIGYVFKNKNLLKQSLTHTSYTNENINSKDNERLEFLGDGILQFVVTDFLYKNYPEQEGILSSYRANLVNKDSLAEISEKLNMSNFIKISFGQKKILNQKSMKTILADAMEALIGAIYLDGGLKPVNEFISKFITIRIKEIIESNSWIESKTKFQNLIQSTQNITPHYKVVSSTGPDHEKKFIVAAYIGDKKISEGKGTSTKKAEQDAAYNALKEIDK